MLISDLFEADGFWKGVGRSLGQRFSPGVDYTSTNYATGQKLRQMGKKAGKFVSKTAPIGAIPATQAPASPVPPAKDYAQYQTPTVFRKGAQSVQQPAPAVTTAQPAIKPRVLAQPIRVGNKIYRPGDPMHARLAQMMQAQKKT